MIKAVILTKWVSVATPVPHRRPALLVAYPAYRYTDLDNPKPSQISSPLAESKVEVIIDDSVLAQILLDPNYGPTKVISSVAVVMI
jgi:hypothetical protein